MGSTGSVSNDAVAMSAIARGDRLALKDIFERHGDVLYTVALRLTGSDADARDVVQDLFLGLPRALKTFEGRGSLEGWLRTLAARRALMLLRSKRRKGEVSLDAWSDARGRTGPGDPLNRLELERALSELPESMRAVVILKSIEGYTHQDIANQLGISVVASTKRYRRGLALLRERMVHDV